MFKITDVKATTSLVSIRLFVVFLLFFGGVCSVVCRCN